MQRIHSRSPVNCGSCASLPAEGTWEDISPWTAAGKWTWTDVIALDPFDMGTLWSGANVLGMNGQQQATPMPGGGLFKSSDCGAIWTHVNTGMNGNYLDDAAPISIAIDPVHQGVMFATPGSGGSGLDAGLWKSSNGGVDWTQMFPQGSEVATLVEYNLVSSIGMEAKNPNHIVVSMHALCHAPYGPVCEAETTDGGATWVMTTVQIPGLTYWVAGAGAFILDANTWLFSTYSNGLWLTSDRGKSWKNVTPAGASGVTTGKTIIQPFAKASDGNYYLGTMEGMITSKDGLQWSAVANATRTVGITMGNDHIYSSDQWSNTYRA